LQGEKVRHASLTDVGVKRSHNQDACATQPAGDNARFTNVGHLFIVADGMGGHAVGEKASAMAVRGIPLTFQKYVGQEGVVPALRRAFRDTNAEIHDIGAKNPEFAGLGTTGTILVLRPEGAWIGHVGDSRAYRIRKGKVEQLTFDHSWVWEIARRQGIDPDELGDFKKNVIVRSLGPDPEVSPDVEGPHPVEPGDIYLLCSDGLSNQVPPDEIGAVVTALPPEDAVKFLIELANVRGGPDNITAVVVQIPGTPSETPADAPKKPLLASVKQLFKTCDKHIPWSYSVLAFGSLLAILALAFKMEWLFVIAALSIIGGIVGLIMHFKMPAAHHRADAESDDIGELRVYKGYNFEHSTPLLDRFAEVEAQLSESLKDREEGVDWNAHAKWTQASAEQLTKSDILSAFRSRCKAVHVLATAYNRDRSKEESFSPNYTARH
jgi:protein phosphatase